ncbi:23S rRNA (uracil(1939)-C(5))-methyltransferase RlmD [Mucilaginibacter rubeus]|uniref:23S rRNA (Uracil(1939)-C(5))-methyltransferase RlmD n=1 Tax=Mucilaginibacter rubeus TaxID=2027860 RepID=A0AAE6JH61_9SPHI|nr:MULTISPECIES: 23S rRNA (uracil(1939)-C(5))-methyltransferase RlmD [Mucilaginibacter]QEM05619.1 23S rRNA (uracil(1939)-C(5))-methyltransferase RlmD [Mucilaginibacter rubeus]QEM18206.1 23S rRNA (uracil(1939)-C(5))-methyltransferase RlmD [Mucilaginibacter gossypii]QTE45260.1 23S rRNA (uracil(1939)-C(5))-methyltransferase RlmD [Mucilaginibacter rubeus]QTE51856.1 23S rRNA (uracil(1939)-C(5))-methyltransferase RlmD [Mucilaginibacter rubeus]QTE56944.1 23S rRNA (uracil(1939)-C(5))-methyltransferase
MSKANKPKFFENVQIIDIAEEGKGVGKADDFVLFVDKAVPGDVADVQLYRSKKNFGEGKITELKQASEYRTQAFCEHFGTCGGCKWQHMTYEAQLKFKQKSVVDALSRLAKINVEGIMPIVPSPADRYYRNKLEFTFSNKRWLYDGENKEDGTLNMNALGFHIPGRFDKILDVNHCYLQAEPSNSLRNEIRDFTIQQGYTYYDLRNHSGMLRNLVVRTSSTGEIMVIVVFAYAEQSEIDSLMSHIDARFPEITSLLYIVNQKKNDTIFDQDVVAFKGPEYIHEEMNGIKFRIGPKSFYQTNSIQALRLYEITRDFADFKGDELVYDLYTGAGTIANFVAGHVREVVGVEYVPTAIEDAKVNSAINNITNTKFYAGDMKDVLVADFVAEHGKPDVIITDPPRAGMHPDVVARLMEIEAPKIVYVSCNAATQARDLLVLKEKYDTVKIQPVDMFPHTQHVENVVLLLLRD